MIGDALQDIFELRAFHKFQINDLLKEQLISSPFISDNDEESEFEVEETESEIDQVQNHYFIFLIYTHTHKGTHDRLHPR